MTLKKTTRVLLYVLFGLILVVLAVQVSINFYINKRLAGDLKQRVKEATHDQYSLDIRSAGISFFNRSIELNDVEFTPRPCTSCRVARYKVTASGISLDEIDIIHYIRSKAISAGTLHVKNLTINIYQADGIFKKRDTTAPRLSLYKILSGKLSELAIQNIKISDTKLRLFKAGNDSVEILLSDDNDIAIEKFLFNKRVDSLERLFLADKLSMTMKTFSYCVPTGLYTIRGKNMTASYSDSLLTIDSLRLIPNYGKKDFSEAAGRQVSRVKLSVGRVAFKNMDLSLFTEHNWFIAKKLDVAELDLDVYRDKNPEFKPVHAASVQEIIRKIPFFILIDTIGVRHSNIEYNHLAKGTKRPGRVTFNHLKGTITGLRNDSGSYKSDLKLKMHVTGRFMDKGQLSAVYIFPLNTTKEIFECSGKIVDMPLQYFNPMLENTVFVSIKSGHLDTMSFSFHANEYKSKGWMKFLYHGLKVELMDKDDKKLDLKKKVMTFLTNKFVINDQNPKKGENPVVTNIEYERYPYKYLFYYTWKSLQSGIMPAIGIKNAGKVLKQSDVR